MSALYQLTSLPITIMRLSDNAGIPADLGNADYQAFLAYVAAGNTPAAAPVVPNPVTIGRSEYLARFTTAEMTAWQNYVLTHSTTSTSIILGTAVGGATWAWIWTVLGAPTVTLTDSGTVAAHSALVSAGILTAARSATILTP